MLSPTSLPSANAVLRPEALATRPPWKARVRLVSPAGAYLLANEKKQVGARLQFQVGRQPITLCVTRCVTQPTGGFALTCFFEGEPDRRVLQALKPSPSPVDQREWARLPCTSLARFLPVDAAGAQERWARLADISAHGLCLVTNQSLPQGTLLALELGAATQVKAVGQVMHARQQPSGSWHVGCLLEAKLVDDELWRLVSDNP
jgi:hypothetical protein